MYFGIANGKFTAGAHPAAGSLAACRSGWYCKDSLKMVTWNQWDFGIPFCAPLDRRHPTVCHGLGWQLMETV